MKTNKKKHNTLLYALIIVAVLLIKAVTGNFNVQDLEALTSLTSQSSGNPEQPVLPTEQAPHLPEQSPQNS
ncbi:MAG: hypothetical protein HFG51_03910, partial [Lachnospiraceae bacterium]|nr:hypothetical protein [Lachnospiraceae bacterium]